MEWDTGDGWSPRVSFEDQFRQAGMMIDDSDTMARLAILQGCQDGGIDVIDDTDVLKVLMPVKTPKKGPSAAEMEARMEAAAKAAARVESEDVHVMRRLTPIKTPKKSDGPSVFASPSQSEASVAEGLLGLNAYPAAPATAPPRGAATRSSPMPAPSSAPRPGGFVSLDDGFDEPIRPESPDEIDDSSLLRQLRPVRTPRSTHPAPAEESDSRLLEDAIARNTAGKSREGSERGSPAGAGIDDTPTMRKLRPIVTPSTPKTAPAQTTAVTSSAFAAMLDAAVTTDMIDDLPTMKKLRPISTPRARGAGGGDFYPGDARPESPDDLAGMLSTLGLKPLTPPSHGGGEAAPPGLRTAPAREARDAPAFGAMGIDDSDVMMKLRPVSTPRAGKAAEPKGLVWTRPGFAGDDLCGIPAGLKKISTPRAGGAPKDAWAASKPAGAGVEIDDSDIMVGLKKISTPRAGQAAPSAFSAPGPSKLGGGGVEIDDSDIMVGLKKISTPRAGQAAPSAFSAPGPSKLGGGGVEIDDSDIMASLGLKKISTPRAGQAAPSAFSAPGPSKLGGGGVEIDDSDIMASLGLKKISTPRAGQAAPSAFSAPGPSKLGGGGVEIDDSDIMVGLKKISTPRAGQAAPSAFSAPGPSKLGGGVEIDDSDIMASLGLKKISTPRAGQAASSAFAAPGPSKLGGGVEIDDSDIMASLGLKKISTPRAGQAAPSAFSAPGPSKLGGGGVEIDDSDIMASLGLKKISTPRAGQAAPSAFSAPGPSKLGGAVEIDDSDIMASLGLKKISTPRAGQAAPSAFSAPGPSKLGGAVEIDDSDIMASLGLKKISTPRAGQAAPSAFSAPGLSKLGGAAAAALIDDSDIMASLNLKNISTPRAGQAAPSAFAAPATVADIDDSDIMASLSLKQISTPRAGAGLLSAFAPEGRSDDDVMSGLKSISTPRAGAGGGGAFAANVVQGVGEPGSPARFASTPKSTAFTSNIFNSHAEVDESKPRPKANTLAMRLLGGGKEEVGGVDVPESPARASGTPRSTAFTSNTFGSAAPAVEDAPPAPNPHAMRLRGGGKRSVPEDDAPESPARASGTPRSTAFTSNTFGSESPFMSEEWGGGGASTLDDADVPESPARASSTPRATAFTSNTFGSAAANPFSEGGGSAPAAMSGKSLKGGLNPHRMRMMNQRSFNKGRLQSAPAAAAEMEGDVEVPESPSRASSTPRATAFTSNTFGSSNPFAAGSNDEPVASLGRSFPSVADEVEVPESPSRASSTPRATAFTSNTFGSSNPFAEGGPDPAAKPINPAKKRMGGSGLLRQSFRRRSSDVSSDDAVGGVDVPESPSRASSTPRATAFTSNTFGSSNPFADGSNDDVLSYSRQSSGGRSAVPSYLADEVDVPESPSRASSTPRATAFTSNTFGSSNPFADNGPDPAALSGGSMRMGGAASRLADDIDVPESPSRASSTPRATAFTSNTFGSANPFAEGGDRAGAGGAAAGGSKSLNPHRMRMMNQRSFNKGRPQPAPAAAAEMEGDVEVPESPSRASSTPRATAFTSNTFGSSNPFAAGSNDEPVASLGRSFPSVADEVEVPESPSRASSTPRATAFTSNTFGSSNPFAEGGPDPAAKPINPAKKRMGGSGLLRQSFRRRSSDVSSDDAVGGVDVPESPSRASSTPRATAFTSNTFGSSNPFADGSNDDVLSYSRQSSGGRSAVPSYLADEVDVPESPSRASSTPRATAFTSNTFGSSNPFADNGPDPAALSGGSMRMGGAASRLADDIDVPESPSRASSTPRATAFTSNTFGSANPFAEGGDRAGAGGAAAGGSKSLNPHRMRMMNQRSFNKGRPQPAPAAAAEMEGDVEVPESPSRASSTPRATAFTSNTFGSSNPFAAGSNDEPVASLGRSFPSVADEVEVPESPSRASSTPRATAFTSNTFGSSNPFAEGGPDPAAKPINPAKKRMGGSGLLRQSFRGRSSDDDEVGGVDVPESPSRASSTPRATAFTSNTFGSSNPFADGSNDDVLSYSRQSSGGRSAVPSHLADEVDVPESPSRASSTPRATAFTSNTFGSASPFAEGGPEPKRGATMGAAPQCSVAARLMSGGGGKGGNALGGDGADAIPESPRARGRNPPHTTTFSAFSSPESSSGHVPTRPPSASEFSRPGRSPSGLAGEVDVPESPSRASSTPRATAFTSNTFGSASPFARVGGEVSGSGESSGRSADDKDPAPGHEFVLGSPADSELSGYNESSARSSPRSDGGQWELAEGRGSRSPRGPRKRAGTAAASLAAEEAVPESPSRKASTPKATPFNDDTGGMGECPFTAALEDEAARKIMDYEYYHDEEDEDEHGDEWEEGSEKSEYSDADLELPSFLRPVKSKPDRSRAARPTHSAALARMCHGPSRFAAQARVETETPDSPSRFSRTPRATQFATTTRGSVAMPRERGGMIESRGGLAVSSTLTAPGLSHSSTDDDRHAERVAAAHAEMDLVLRVQSETSPNQRMEHI